MTTYGTLRQVLALLALLGCWIGSAQAGTNQWSTAGSLSNGRDAHTATLLPSGKVLVAGGGGNGSPLSSAELYDPTTNNWSAAGSLASARQSHTATLLPSGKVLVAGGWNGTANLATAELYDPVTSAWSAAGSLADARQLHTATLLPSGKVLIVGGNGSSSSGLLSSAELYDPTTNTWSAAGSLASARESHTATLLPSGKVLVTGGVGVSGITNSAELYDPATNTWSAAGMLAAARMYHTATLLPSGKALVAGGWNGADYPDNAELYDPATNTWSAAGSMAIALSQHTATLLPSGKVLAAGGVNNGGSITSSAELYDPATNTWAVTTMLASARYLYTATLLPSGKLLVAGGTGRSAYLNSAELYDPAAISWSAAGSLASARQSHTATLLPSGKVLVAGGWNGTADLATAELYDPVTSAWSAAGSLADARQWHTATLLSSGKVLVAGGNGSSSSGLVASAELYDPATNTWSAAGALASARESHTATLLVSGKVLVTGGVGVSGITNSAELYDPATSTWSAAGMLATARMDHTATLLPSGKVLVAGGWNGAGYPANAELYDPATNTWSAAGSMVPALSQHTATLLPSGKVLAAGGVDGSGSITSSAELYDPATNTWSAAGMLAYARYLYTATLLPSGKLLAAGGIGRNGYLNSAELYDPATNVWSGAGAMATARQSHAAALLPSGKVLIVGGTNFGSTSIYLNSAELFDAGLSPDATRIPSLSAVNGFLLMTSALTAAANGSRASAGALLSTGFMPNLEGSGGSTNSSASNMPVLQIQRIDNEQMLFVPNDETVNISDTSFTGNATAFAGFPAGPVRVRAWVNGVPSKARYSTFATTPGQPASPTASGGTSRATVTFTAVGEDGGAPITGYTARATPGGATVSCTAPCTSLVFSSIAVGTYTFTVAATNAAGTGPASPASNSVGVVAATTTKLVSSTNPSKLGQNVIFTATVAGKSPTGTVTFNDGSTTLCSATLTSSSAACSNSLLSVGTHSITAVYSGDTNNLGSTSTMLSQLVNPAATTTIVVSTANPSTFGQNVTFTATVSGSSPTGAVTFTDGVTPVCSNVALRNGSAGCSISTLSVGSHSLVASYSGDAKNAASTSSALIQTVNSDSPPVAMNLNQHGLSGSWGRSNVPGTRQGFLFNFYPDNIAPGHGTVFAGWYTYDVAGGSGGQRWYALQGDIYNNISSASLGIYTSVDGDLSSGSRPVNSQVGTATLSFSDCSTGMLAYAFNDGRSGSIPLSRVTHSTATCSASGDTGVDAHNYLLSGAWGVPNTIGMGFVIDVSPADKVLLGSWYTFFPTGNSAPSPRQQWFVFQDSNFSPTQTSSSNIDLLQASGGTFDATVGGGITTAVVGKVSLTFTSCTTATLTYAISTESVSQNTVDLVRIGPAPAGCAL